MVVTWNRRDVLLATLRAISQQTRPTDTCFVVDNASVDDTAATVEALGWCRLIRMPENVGPGGGLHEGMRQAFDEGHDFSWTLDDDSVPIPEALERLLAAQAAVPMAEVVGVGPAGGRVRAGMLHHVPATDLPLAAPGVRRSDFTLIDGALVSRAAQTRVGLPRVDFFHTMEDIDFTLRVRRAGGEVVVLEDRLIERLHLGSGGSGTRTPPWRGYYQTRNQLRMALDARSPVLVAGWAVRTMRFIAAAIGTEQGGARIRLRLRGALDAVRHRMGRTVEPSDG